MPTASTGGSIAISKPTKWRWSTTTGRLQKQDPNSTVWNNFTVKGLNYSPTPPGWTPEYPHRAYGVTDNISQIRKFSSMLKNINGNTLRVYVNMYGVAFPTGGPGNIYDRTDPVLLLKFLDECYKNGVYILLDIYVNFSYNSTPRDKYHYRTLIAQQMLQAVAVTKDHPAIMGYVLGNETNLGYSLVHETLASWLKLANDIGKEVAVIDNGNHLYGPCNIMSNDIIAAENNGDLNACNVHFFNAYPNPQWNEDGTNANTGQFSNWRTFITNNKKFIITETGYSSWNATLQSGGGFNARATAVLSAGVVTTINITNGGTGYNTAPTVKIGGGLNNTATATATISGGAVTGINITNGGTGYSTLSIPIVYIGGAEDETAHALAVGKMWDNFLKPAASLNGGGQDVCGGVCYFASNDELWKSGGYLSGDQVTPAIIANDGNYTHIYNYDESWDSTNLANPVRKSPIPTMGYINPVGDGRFYEQHFGWWRYADTMINSNLLVPKVVVTTMTNKWL